MDERSENMADPTWFDLSGYRLEFQLVRGDQKADRVNSLRARGAGAEAYAEELRELGFERGPDGWLRPANIGMREFADDVRSQFPQVRMIKMPRGQVVGRNDDPVQVSYTTVGEHRGRRRVWLEGLRLSDAGFEKGAAYSVVLDLERRTITLTIDADGDRVVSGRARANRAPTPIIDVASEALSEIVSEGMRLQAVIRPGQIQFTLAAREVAKAEREARLCDQVTRGYLTEGTLCAGAGVSTLAISEGVQRAGLRSRVDWIVDRERRYLEIANDNNPAVTGATRLFEASLEELAPCLLSKASLLSISLPCTLHSRSGKAKRKLAVAEDHPTDTLAIFGALRLIDAVQPSAIISENITLASTSASYAILRAYLTENRYKIFETVLDHEQAGTIESRQRWWMVCLSEGLAEGFSLDQLPQIARKYARLGEVLEPVSDDNPSWSGNEYLHRKAARDALEGKNFKRQLVGEDATTVGCIGRGYSKRRSTEAQLTRADGLERLLTPTEHARVKGIPESLVAGVSSTVAHEALGQSILFGHAVALGERVAEHMIVAAERITKRRAPGL